MATLDLALSLPPSTPPTLPPSPRGGWEYAVPAHELLARVRADGRVELREAADVALERGALYLLVADARNADAFPLRGWTAPREDECLLYLRASPGAPRGIAGQMRASELSDPGVVSQLFGAGVTSIVVGVGSVYEASEWLRKYAELRPGVTREAAREYARAAFALAVPVGRDPASGHRAYVCDSHAARVLAAHADRCPRDTLFVAVLSAAARRTFKLCAGAPAQLIALPCNHDFERGVRINPHGETGRALRAAAHWFATCGDVVFAAPEGGAYYPLAFAAVLREIVGGDFGRAYECFQALLRAYTFFDAREGGARHPALAQIQLALCARGTPRVNRYMRGCREEARARRARRAFGKLLHCREPPYLVMDFFRDNAACLAELTDARTDEVEGEDEDGGGDWDPAWEFEPDDSPLALSDGDDDDGGAEMFGAWDDSLLNAPGSPSALELPGAPLVLPQPEPPALNELLFSLSGSLSDVLEPSLFFGAM